MDEPVQKSLERYDVLDRIAVGGMAEVFLAKAYGAHGFEKTLAIKRILPELARDPEFEARFIAEAKVAVRLSHANVVQVFDFGRYGESLFIAMEYVDGLDLAALLRKFKDEGRLVPLPAAFHIAIEIMRALDFAHTHNVVHRDISPSNILISRAGEVKIGDFGIAVAASPHKKAGGTGPRKVMGKWRYMSPEQTRGDTLDTRSDMFSAASVLFELFTGEKLFPGDEAETIIKNIDSMPIPRASALRSGLPSRLDEILAGPLSRKPIDRPSRPATVLRSLIELSYESSIMATALDVAEAVAAVLPAKRTPGAAMLDDVIRKQLGDAKDKSVARRTAVTDGKPPSTATVERNEVSTGLFRKISDDGISRLEEVEVDPTNVRRDLSEHEMPSASSADSGLHKLLDAYKDPDRRTEVGGPPTGAVPKSDPDAPSGEQPPEKKRAQTKTGSKTKSKSITAELPGSPARWPIALAVLLVAGGGVAAWRLMRTDSHTAAPVVRDAAVTATDDMGQLEIDPDPEGATGTITGEDGVAHPFGPTSHAKKTRLRVTANKDLKIHLEAPGYTPLDRTARVEPNVVMSIAPSLQKARATLKVVTTPPGAQVTLGGRLLGETPLTAMDLDAASGVELVLAHTGYEPTRMKVDLALGKTSEVNQALKELPKLGAVKFRVLGTVTWANVYYKGKNLGRDHTLQGATTFKLPVGKQQLTFDNPGHKKVTMTIDVTGAPQTVDVHL